MKIDYQVKNEYISTIFGTNLKLSSLFLVIFISLFSILEGKPAELQYKDIPVRSEEILKWHANYKVFNEDLAARTINMYVEELDPSKSYFTEDDLREIRASNIDKKNAVQIDPVFLNQVVKDYRVSKFPYFEELFDRMQKAILRRRKLENEIKNDDLPHSVQSKDLKNLRWAKDESELFDRLKKIRAIQLEVAHKIDPDQEAKTLLLIDKRRKTHEDELLTKDQKLREQLISTAFMKAIASAMDSQTAFFTPTEAKQFLIGVQQRLFGIGVLMRDDIDGFSIIKIVEGGPAEKSGALHLKDKIIAVDEEPVVGLDVGEVVEKIRGPEGTDVVLTVLRETATDLPEKEINKLDITIERAEVVIKESRYDIKTEAYGNGVLVTLVLHSFYQDQESSSTSDLTSALKKVLRENKVMGVLLDLRSNPGGLLSEAVSVAGLFIKKGIVVSIKDERGNVQHLRNLETSQLWSGPLVVLVNRASASAAEIVAQTLQDYGRAIVVGDATSFGKGSFQIFTVNPSQDDRVNPKGEFKVTRGCYYTPSGQTPQLRGVVSDILIPGPLADAEIGERYAEYPLQANSIPPSFVDTLSDVPFFQRGEIRKLYLFDLEQPTDGWKKYIYALKKNSDQRRLANKEYTHFLEQAKQASEDVSIAESLLKEPDYQGQEAMSLLKDLVYFVDLTQKEESPQDENTVTGKLAA